MPRGDRTGPWGEGPETGRGAGWCHSGDRPGYESAPVLGRGRNRSARGTRQNCSGYRRGWRFIPSHNLVPEETKVHNHSYSLVERLDQVISLIEQLNATRKNRE